MVIGVRVFGCVLNGVGEIRLLFVGIKCRILESRCGMKTILYTMMVQAIAFIGIFAGVILPLPSYVFYASAVVEFIATVVFLVSYIRNRENI